MKILITGGHLAPALAFIQHCPEDVEIVYAGRKHPFEGDSGLSLEYQKITELGIPFIPLQTGRLQRQLTRHSLTSLLKIPSGINQARAILKKEKPDVVVGFGGYLSVPLGLASWSMKIPLILHEQTLHAGLANKFLAKFATKIAVSWESSFSYFPKNKTELIGNLHLTTRPSDNIKRLVDDTKDLPRLVITGGSAGSHAINVLIEQILSQLLEKYEVIHQTGDAKEFGDYDRLHIVKETLPQEQQKRYHLMKFIDPLDFEYLVSHASLVISRAGMNTVTTLLLTQTPSLLIPLESGQKNEQLANAKFLEKLGLAEIFHQTQKSDQLFERVYRITHTEVERKNEKSSMYKELIDTAATRFVELVYVLSQRNLLEKS